MPNAILWGAAPVDEGSILTTELNALADGSRSAGGTELDNSANLDTYGQLELNVTFATSPDAGGHVKLYMITAPDGTNYSDGSDTVDPGADTWVLDIPVRAVTSAQRKVTKMFPIPNAKIKFILENQAGFAFPATGSTVELYTSNYEVQ